MVSSHISDGLLNNEHHCPNEDVGRLWQQSRKQRFAIISSAVHTLLYTQAHYATLRLNAFPSGSTEMLLESERWSQRSPSLMFRLRCCVSNHVGFWSSSRKSRPSSQQVWLLRQSSAPTRSCGWLIRAEINAAVAFLRLAALEGS